MKQLCDCMLCLQWDALQDASEVGKPDNVTLKYDFEPLPSDFHSEQRFFHGEWGSRQKSSVCMMPVANSDDHCMDIAALNFELTYAPA